jgi:hypothetical protein
MKKNLLSIAVAASVAGTSAQASMYLNPEGTGQVLLFPYYNAENNNETSIHIVNTTTDAKAVKVRILEYVNSQEVLDFNVYMSAEDHFSFTIYTDPNGTGGALITRDNTCTVPALGDSTAGVPGSTEVVNGKTVRVQPFLPYAYADDIYDSIYRTKIGHVEVIEMGTLTGAWAADATHGADGVPADCAQLVTNWSTGGIWTTDPGNNIGDPAGGIYGVANILNNGDAASWGMEAGAIADFWELDASDDEYSSAAERHTNPGEREPSLASGKNDSLVPNMGAYGTYVYDAAVDAVSSLFMTESVSNDVMVNPALSGQTDWVITFPTRRYYVDNEVAAIPPFTDLYAGAVAPNSSCEEILVEQWDREEAFIPPVIGGPIFSPRPPAQPDDPAASICYETNTIAAGSATSAMGATMSTSTTAAAGVSLDFSYSEGWQRITFNDAAHEMDAEVGATLQGLPAMGFAAFKYSNGTSNYGFASDHKTSTATS